MNGVFVTAVEVADFMLSKNWEFCVIGGLAVQHWGEPRTTLDADFTLLCDWGSEEEYIDALLSRFEARIEDAPAFALKHRVLLIRGSNGTPADISLGALPFEVEMVERAIGVAFSPAILLPCCTAEDLFVMKAFASRPGDWIDAESISNRQKVLDKNYIMRHLRILAELKEEPEIVDRAKRVLRIA